MSVTAQSAAHSAIVRDRFSAEAENWQQLYDRSDRSIYAHNVAARRERVLTLLEDVSGKLLELGCGAGNIATRLVRSDRHVIGADFSTAMLHRAHRSALDEAVDLSLVSADAVDVPIGSNTIDGVVSVGLIEYVNHPEDLITECHRVLKPGGKLVLSMPNAESPFILIDDAVKGIKNTITQTVLPSSVRRFVKRGLGRQDRAYFSHRRHRLNPAVIIEQMNTLGFNVDVPGYHTFGLGILNGFRWNTEFSRLIESRIPHPPQPEDETLRESAIHRRLEKTGWTCILKATKRL